MDKRKCPEHNMWMRKPRRDKPPVCELCKVKLDLIQRENERTGGSNKPKVKIGKF